MGFQSVQGICLVWLIGAMVRLFEALVHKRLPGTAAQSKSNVV